MFYPVKYWQLKGAHAMKLYILLFSSIVCFSSALGMEKKRPHTQEELPEQPAEKKAEQQESVFFSLTHDNGKQEKMEIPLIEFEN